MKRWAIVVKIFQLECSDNTDNTSLSWYSVSEKLTLTDTIIQPLILVSRMRIALLGIQK